MTIFQKILFAVALLLLLTGIVLAILAIPQNPYGPVLLASTGFLGICILSK